MPDTSVEEAVAVLKDAAKTPRARAVISMLAGEFQVPDEHGTGKTTGKPRFPTEQDVAKHYARDENDESAKGSNSPSDEDEAKGTATARKGS